MTKIEPKFDSPLAKYPIELLGFYGSIDLLIGLVERDELDVYSLGVAEVAQQFIGYLPQMAEQDQELAYEFLVLLASLLELKSKKLLPKPAVSEEELVEYAESPDYEIQLRQKLQEYGKYKQVSETLRAYEALRSKIFSRPVYTMDGSIELEPATLVDLLLAFHGVLGRAQAEVRGIAREHITVRQKMQEICQLIKTGWVKFVDLFTAEVTKLEVIVTFLALLELIKQRRIRVLQTKLFGEIRIYKYEKVRTTVAEKIK